MTLHRQTSQIPVDLPYTTLEFAEEMGQSATVHLGSGSRHRGPHTELTCKIHPPTKSGFLDLCLEETKSLALSDTPGWPLSHLLGLRSDLQGSILALSQHHRPFQLKRGLGFFLFWVEQTLLTN